MWAMLVFVLLLTGPARGCVGLENVPFDPSALATAIGQFSPRLPGCPYSGMFNRLCA